MRDLTCHIGTLSFTSGQWHQQIEEYSGRITAVYAFFNNDYSGYSPATANKFKQIVGLAPAEIRPYQQGRLF